MEQFAFVLKY